MSMLTYLASNRKLPNGDFVTRPDAVYSSYANYRESKDYIAMESVILPPPFEFTPAVYGTDCPVWIYNEQTNDDYFSIYDHDLDYPTTILLPDVGQTEVPDDRIEQSIKMQEVTHHFSVPYVYDIGQFCDEESLQKFLCEYLEPGDIAECYSCWALEEYQTRDKQYDLMVDLQRYLDCQDISLNVSKYSKDKRKVFVTYHAPTSGRLKNDWIQREDVIIVYKNENIERIPYYIAKKFGTLPKSYRHPEQL